MNLPSKRGKHLMVLNGAAIGTYYPDPTGEGTPAAAAYRASTTATDSPFTLAGRSVVLHKINILRGSGATSTVALQTHAGTLIATLGIGVGGGAADQEINWGDEGVNVPGGFRLVVAGATAQVAVQYAVEKSVAP